MADLTTAHWRVVALAQAGLSNRQIAAASGTSLSTVKNQLNEIYHRSPAVNRAELVARAQDGALGAGHGYDDPRYYRDGR